VSLSDKHNILISILCCPDCHGDLDFDRFCCKSCSRTFVKNGEQYRFTNVLDVQEGNNGDWLNLQKDKIKRLAPWLYPRLITLLGPVYSPFSSKKFVKSLKGNGIVVNLGSGTTIVDNNVINVDCVSYQSVDVVGDLAALPFRDRTLDGIVNISVLEHVPNPGAIVKEFHRTLRPGAKIACFVPFIQGFHASPNDFHRYTCNGLKMLFSDFVIERLIPAGPTSGMLWVLQEWLSMVFSFGNLKIYRFLLPIFWLLSPLKYLDKLLWRHPAAMQITSGHTVIATK